MPNALRIFLDYFISIAFAVFLFAIAFLPVIMVGYGWGTLAFAVSVLLSGWYIARSQDPGAAYVALLAWIVLAAGFAFGVLCRVLM